MNINKYLDKLGIKYTFINGVFEFTLADGTIKKIVMKDLERYLFIKMIEYIESEHT